MLEKENYYLKTILSKVSGETVKGRLNNNQLLKEIASKIGSGGGSGADFEKLAVTITYTDSTSETVDLAVWSDE